MKVDVLVVGAGFAGAVMAERFASAGKSVLVIDRRPHIAGNAHDHLDNAGVLVHQYGPHIFHTNAPAIVEYLSRFTEWIPYEHKVLASVDGSLYPIPINRTTINRLYGLHLDEAGVAKFLEHVREKRDHILTSEDIVLNSVGRDLCDRFFRNYTRKQWNLDLSELSSAVAGRIPVRTNDDDRYFADSFQKMPREGYTAMFTRLLDHPNIRVELGTTYQSVRGRVEADLTVFSGPIDEFYDFRHGKLAYRSLRFEHEHLSGKLQFQPVGTVNYPNDFDFTRITEFKHLTGQKHSGTSIVREYPSSVGDPYYPIPNSDTAARYALYQKAALMEKNVLFVGRLAEYKYYNMDQVVAAALKLPGSISMSETVAAVVVAFNRKKLLVECLHGLLMQTRPVDVVFVIDNASTDGTGEHLRDVGLLNEPRIHYKPLSENLGGAGGFTYGMEAAFAAGYDWIWLMDDDAEPFSDALEQFMPFMQEPGTVALANLKLDTDGNFLRYHLGKVQWHSSLDLVLPLSDTLLTAPGKVPVEFSSFIGLLVRREAVIKTGFPRREFFIHCDDFEYSVRLSAVGSLYLVPSSKILHKEKIAAPSTEKHWGSATYRCVAIEKYAFEFFGIRNRIWTLLLLSKEPKMYRWSRIARDLAGMAARIVLYERNHRFLRLCLLGRGALDAFQGHFDNSIPFKIRKRLAARERQA